jgi:hypothetical protein
VLVCARPARARRERGPAATVDAPSLEVLEFVAGFDTCCEDEAVEVAHDRVRRELRLAVREAA